MGRHWVVAGLFVLSLITYIDRAAISSVKEPMAAELGFSDREMGAVFSAFALGYALAQVPSGWAADRFGPRLMLSVVVVFWSLLTALTGAVGQFVTLLVVRFAFGVAEAGAFPGSARAFYNWLPVWEHGRANGIIFAASRLGAAIAFPVMAWLLTWATWRTAFYWLALPGMVWGIGWWIWFRDEPAVAVEKAANVGPETGFGEIFRSRVMLLAMSQYFIVNFTTFLCLTWMLPYLKTRFGLAASEAAFYAMIPLLVGATAQWATGTMVDLLYRSRWVGWSRRLPAMVGFALSAVGIVAIPWVEDVRVAVGLFTLAAFGAEMTISPSWAFCMDIGGKKSGAISGAMNMMGNLGSFVSANLFPVLGAGYFVLVMGLNLYCVGAWYWMRGRGGHG
ncbi:MAG: MFS transporter [Acidobacteria bacterium]|nr:MFS transporter [Acidobacteriota bacterium]